MESDPYIGKRGLGIANRLFGASDMSCDPKVPTLLGDSLHVEGVPEQTRSSFDRKRNQGRMDSGPVGYHAAVN
jgi:hypothetical protein